MDDLRKLKDSPLTIPDRTEIYLSGKRQVFDLKVFDISASGAFIYTREAFSNGTNLQLNLVIPNAKIKKITGAECLIDCEGTVVRSTPAGVRIHFDKDCRISSLIGL